MNKHVFEKIAKLGKTELSEVKVDLALADELKKSLANYKSLPQFLNSASEYLGRTSKTYTEALKEFNNSKSNAQTLLSKYTNAYDETGVLLNKVKTSAEALGIKPSEISGYSELDKVHMDLVKSYTSLKELFNKVNK
jgi:hypothetical protein